MWTTYFRDPRALERVRATLAEPYLDGFVREFEEARYAPSSILSFIHAAGHLAHWLGREGLEVGQIEAVTLDRFRDHLHSCDCDVPRPVTNPGSRVGQQAERFVRYLEHRGVVVSVASRSARVTEPALLVDFGGWMRTHRGATDTTIRIYGRVIRDLLGALGEDPSRFDAAALRTFIIEAASPHGRSKAKMVVTAARAFLRYLISEGHCRLGLDGAIPTIGRWRLAALPRYLPASDIDRLVAACDPAVSQGARDRAIILLLARLGLRAGDVAALRMADIDWVRATLLVSGKSRAATTLPLPQDVGDAILLYLEHGRPATEVAEIFVRGLAPRTGLGRSGVTSVVASAMRRAGVISPSRGAHTLRHSAATAMLRQGASLAAIGAVLRHRSEETTRLYAKVDFALLRQLALPWPEVSPC